nr:hypothetical protein OH820_33750 [Streptomyces sp. NBC_00857]
MEHESLAVAAEQPRVHRLLQRTQQLDGKFAQHLREVARGESAAQHRGDLQHVPRPLGQLVQPAAHRPQQRLRQPPDRILRDGHDDRHWFRRARRPTAVTTD